jgi:hypothetical protein
MKTNGAWKTLTFPPAAAISSTTELKYLHLQNHLERRSVNHEARQKSLTWALLETCLSMNAIRKLSSQQI